MDSTRIETNGVAGWLEMPTIEPCGKALVLTHGAGSNSNAAILKLVGQCLRDHGWTVLRCDLPFRQRHHGPPRPSEAAHDREGLKKALAVLRKEAGDGAQLYLGGHSYGGRQASMLAAEDPRLDAKGLLLMSYPLHPPAKPQQLRTAHLPDLRIPAFFAHGARDEFGTHDEMEAALPLIPAATKLFMVEGAGHDLGNGKKLAFVDAFLEFVLGAVA